MTVPAQSNLKERSSTLNSIGMTLIQRIFGVYCLIAIAITGFQGWGEVRITQDRILVDMQSQQSQMQDSLSNAVWNFDQLQVNNLAEGILSNISISGVQITLDDGSNVLSAGKTVLDQQGQQHMFMLTDPQNPGGDIIGSVTLYSSSDIIFQTVKPTLISLLIAALIKTLALWFFFLYFCNKLLSKPLYKLISTVKNLPLDDASEPAQQNKHNETEIELLNRAVCLMEAKLNQTLRALHDANAQLSQKNLNLQHAIEQSPTLTAILTTDGELLYHTNSFTDLTGFAAEEADNFFQQQVLKHIDLEDVLQQLYTTGLDQPRSHCYKQIGFRNKEGQARFIDITLALINDENEQQLLLSATNITKLKTLSLALRKTADEQKETIAKLESTQNQLQQSEKLASIGQLAAGVAHEINNPISFINSNNRTLSQYTADLIKLLEIYEQLPAHSEDFQKQIDQQHAAMDYEFLREDMRGLLKDTLDGGERVRKIVADLLQFSRTNETEFAFSDVHEGLESTLTVVWNELKYKVEVIRDFDNLPEINCVQSQLNQVFMNLIVNAGHAIKDKGTITLRTRALDENSISIEIEDTGSGIAPEHLDTLFDPFFTTKPVGEGTGLGLSVSYGIIKKHRGEISVKSEQGKGTCFHIRLPINPEILADESEESSETDDSLA